MAIAPKKNTAKARPSDTEEEEVENLTVEQKQEPSSVTASVAEFTRVDVSSAKAKDIVMITMHETISPPPFIGGYNIPLEMKISSLQERKNYRLPKYVAQVIVDAGKAEYLSVEG